MTRVQPPTAKQLEAAAADPRLAAAVRADWRDPAWYPRARCRDADVDMFFPDNSESSEPGKAFCRGCPVLAHCLAFALAHPKHDAGIFGGTTERERRAMRAILAEAQPAVTP